MNATAWQGIIRNFPKGRIVVIGDVMLDAYTHGVAERLSVEAPVPIIIEQSKRYVLGGAGNVANNIAALGGKVILCGVVGNDVEGRIVKKLCKAAGITPRLVIDSSRPTTQKHRVISSHHQVVRLDKESAHPLSDKLAARLIRGLRGIKNAGLVIFSDYAKGVVGTKVMSFAKKHFGAKKIIADFKPSQAALYKSVRVLLPNIKETHGLIGIEAVTNNAAEKAAKELARRFSASVVLKRGEHGMTILDLAHRKIFHIPALEKEVFDVTGAGDTVIAVFGLALVAGADILTAARIANSAASIVVGLEGTATVTPDILSERLKDSIDGLE